jgi:hypothetical protein
MSKLTKRIVWPNIAAVFFTAALIGFAGMVQAFDRAHCDFLFGAANVFRADTFKMNAGRVDFGDGIHAAGWPGGTAVICWSNDGRVAVRGYVYADSIGENVMAIARISFSNNGHLRGTSPHSVSASLPPVAPSTSWWRGPPTGFASSCSMEM